MRLSKAIPRLRFERRRLYAQSKVCPPEMRREYRERAEAIGAVLLLSREQGARMGDTEMKVAETAAGIVGRQMEQ